MTIRAIGLLFSGGLLILAATTGAFAIEGNHCPCKHTTTNDCLCGATNGSVVVRSGSANAKRAAPKGGPTEVKH